MDKPEKYYTQSRSEMLSFIPKTASKILEVGCGRGIFSSQLLTSKREIWGVEINSNIAKEASNKLFKVIAKPFVDALSELPDNYFDVIIFNDVLEHLLYPWDDLLKIKPKLKDNGVIVSSIPNVRYSKNLFNFLFKKDWKYTKQGILDSTHFRFFTKKSIKQLYKKSGYEIISIKGINITKSFAFFPFAVLFNIIFLGTQLDMFFMQYAVVAKKLKK